MTDLVFIDDEGLVAGALVTVMTPDLVAHGFTVRPLAAAVAEVGPPTGRGVAVCDVSLRTGPTGAEAAAALVAGGWRVLLISGRASADAVLDAVAAGARGYVEKVPDDRDALLAAIVDVANHGWHLGPALAEVLYPDLLRSPLPPAAELSTRDQRVLRCFTQGEDLGRATRTCGLSEPEIRASITRVFAAAAARRPTHQLTPRELQVVQAIGRDGLVTAKVADLLGVSASTVNTHLRAIQEKYQHRHPGEPEVMPRTAAQFWARELNLDGSPRD
jgi:DNA-binding NarL/FixJ family response regulator